MKNFIILFSLLLSSKLFARVTESLFLQGTVSQKLSISVTPEAIASALILETSQTDLKVAAVNEISNSRIGYKIFITSVNLGNLKRTDGLELLSYTLKYGGSAVSLLGEGTSIANVSPGAINIKNDLAISFKGVTAEAMVEGTYTDVLTLNIAVN